MVTLHRLSRFHACDASRPTWRSWQSSEVVAVNVAVNNGPFPSLRSLLCLAQRSFPLLVGVVPNEAFRKDSVSDFELSIHFAIEAGCVPSTIKLLRNGFADWAKEGYFEAHLLGPFALARPARVTRQST